MRVRQALAIRLNDVTEVSIHALMRVRLPLRVQDVS